MINKNTGCAATKEEVEEWEEMNRSMPPHRFDSRCDCRQCKGEKFATCGVICCVICHAHLPGSRLQQNKSFMISHKAQQSASRRFSPLSHLWERGRGRGRTLRNEVSSSVSPLPNPLPQVGEGTTELCR